MVVTKPIRMRQLLLALTLSIAFLVGCSPKTTSSATSAPAAAQKSDAPGANDTTLLWKITTPGAAAPSYLFGTIHLIPEEDFFMPNRVVAALNDADEVVFEIDPRDMQDPSMMMRIMGKINMSDGSTLKSLLSEEEYATVKAYFDGSPLPFMFLERMKPLFTSAMVGQDFDDMGGGGGPFGGGMDGMKSYELELTELAEAAGKEIGGLETMEFQLNLFDSIPYEAQADMLYEAVKRENEGQAAGGDGVFGQMVDVYRRQAVAEMAGMMDESGDTSGKFTELLLTKRNQNWAPTIKQQTGDKTMFYAVGAGHLGGENGVIALLRRMDVTVEPVY